MDKTANLLISLKNGGNAGKETVMVPFSNFMGEIAKTLFNAGYIASYAKSHERRETSLNLEFCM